MRTAIIGGGIAGLAAAYELEQARAAGAEVAYTLYESRDRLGGALSTEVVEGVVLERGPDSFISEKPAAAALCRELGLGEALTPSNDAARKTYIVVRNRMVSLPDGLMFLVPTRLIPTALTRLFSISTKIRMGLELLLPPRPSGKPDESVAELVRRHFGQEAVDRLADPLLSGIYGGDATQLSARAVLPRMVEMEAAHGSLVRGMLAAHKKMKAATHKAHDAARSANPSGKSAPSAPRAIFTTLRGGLQQLVDALEARLNPEWIRKSAPVERIRRSGDQWMITAHGQEEPFDAVILASSAWVVSELLAEVDQELSEELGGVPYSSSITVNLVYDEAKLGKLPDGFGFLVPACEGRAMLAATFVHRKFLGRTPAGKAVVRAFLGGMRNETLLDASDEQLVATVRQELEEILGKNVLPVSLQPERTQVARWRRAMAQYAPGHPERVRRIAARVASLPGLKLAGNAYDGIGIPDCIRLGRKASRELVERQGLRG
jgi:oxygen-dependent protoporphyrinogen oxidase